MSGILGGTVSLTVSTVIVKLLGLIYKIPLASLLGDEGMGYFNSAYTVYAFFYLLCTAGVPKAVMMLICEARAKDKREYEAKIVRVASGAFVILGLILTLAFIVFSAPIASLIGSTRSAFTMVAVAPSIIFISLGGVIRGCLSADMRMTNIAVSQVIEGVGKLCFGLVFAMLGQRLKMPLEVLSAMTILGVSIGTGLGLIYLLICSKIKIRSEKTGQSIKTEEKRSIIKSILSISIPITLSAAIMSITNLIDLGMIMRNLASAGYSEREASAMFGNYTTLAVPMFNLAISLVTPISVAHLPGLTSAYHSGKGEEYRKGERSLLEFTAILSAPLMIGMAIFSREILSLLFPSSDIELGSRLLCLISPAILFSSLLIVTNTSLEAMGRVKAPLFSMAIGSLAKVVVSTLLISRTELAILGAPIGTVISYAVALLCSLIIYGRSARGSLPILSTHLSPYFVALASVIIARAVYDRFSTQMPETPLLFISIATSALIYGVFIALLGILSPNQLPKMAKYTKSSEKNYR